MSNQSNVFFILNSHHAQQLPIVLRHPEGDATGNLLRQLVGRHVRLMPAIAWYHSAISLCCVVDDSQDCFKIICHAISNSHCFPLCPSSASEARDNTCPDG